MMQRRSSLSALQKSYDDSYQTCTTAVYYEGHGNEEEAMRCWRSALSQINESQTHRAHSNPHSSQTHSETEQALVDSLQQLELQCKERIDLLQALKMSREDSSPMPAALDEPLIRVSSDPPPYHPERENNGEGWIGQGTVPAISYTELSRPALPPRPSMGSRTSSAQAVVGAGDVPSPDALHAARLPAFASPVPSVKKSRTPSPEKRTMRSTLRSGKPREARRHSSRNPEGPGASKAAALAWSALGLGRDRPTPRPVESPAPSFVSGTHSPVDRRESKSTGAPQPKWDSHTRRLLTTREAVDAAASASASGRSSLDSARRSGEYPFPRPSDLSVNAAAAAASSSSLAADNGRHVRAGSGARAKPPAKLPAHAETPLEAAPNTANTHIRRKAVPNSQTQDGLGRRLPPRDPGRPSATSSRARKDRRRSCEARSSSSQDEDADGLLSSPRRTYPRQKVPPIPADTSSQRSSSPTSATEDAPLTTDPNDPVTAWEAKKKHLLKHLPPGVDSHAAAQILNEIVVRGDDVRWSDVAGLATAKAALREAVVYPFLRPDLFMGLREPARGLLLFGPPGTGKTMLARAVATESRSTFFAISASSLTSKFLGESEKLVRALFALARVLSPAIIFVDEIDSLLSPRSGGGGEHEASRRIKTEFLVQWSGLQRAAAGREPGEGEGGDPNRVLVLAATNLPWAIDEAARRRFVRRQYIPLPDGETREAQIRTLLGEQMHGLGDGDIRELVGLTEGFSGSDITALAKDAAMGPLRSLGEDLLHTTMDQIRPINADDFKASLKTIRPSVSPEGLKEYEDWAKTYGERGG